MNQIELFTTSDTDTSAPCSRMVKVVRIGEPLPAMRMDTPALAYAYWNSVIRRQPWFDPSKEHMVILALNTRCRITDFSLISIGSISETVAHPREILRPAIVLACYSFVLMHNHPSGDPAPSDADQRLTRRIAECCQILNISLTDHVIAGGPPHEGPAFFSFRESGVL